MTLRRSVGLAILLVLAGVAYLALRRGPAQTPYAVEPATDSARAREPSEPAAPSSSAESRDAAPPASAIAPSASPDEATASVDRDRDLHGRVVDPHGQGVGGAAIEVRRRIGREYGVLDLAAFYEAPVVATTATLPTGEFRVPLPRGRPFDLHVAAPGFASADVIDRYAGELVLVVLHPPAVVFGRITRASDGAAASRSRVELVGRGSGVPQFEAESDGAGAYRIDGVPPGDYYLEVTPTEEAPPMWIAVDLAEGVNLEKDVVVTPGYVVKGKVTDAATGQPIAGATIGVGWTFEKTSTSDASGEYVIDGFPVDGVYDVHARAPGYGRSEHDVTAKDGDTLVVDFALAPGRRATGRVVGASGEPIAGATVAAVASESSGEDQKIDWVSATSAADGSFELRDVRADVPHALVAMKEGLGRVVYDFPPTEATDAVVEFGDVVLKAAGEIGGRVLDDTDHPMPDVHVTITGSNDDRSRFSRSSARRGSGYVDGRGGRTDDLGRFRFGDLAAGDYVVKASLQGRPRDADAKVRLATGEAREGVTLVLPAGRCIEGRVTSPAGKGLAMVSVDLQSDGGARGFQRVAYLMTDADGAFRFSGLDDGSYTIHAQAFFADTGDEKFVAASRSGVAAGTLNVVIALRRAASIDGVVLDVDGSPVADVLVQAIEGVDGEADSSVTESDGRFHLDVPDESAFTLEAKLPQTLDPGAFRGVRAWLNAPAATQPGVPAGTRDVVLRLPPR
jgi:protocatechuate 3,4-dioxygenase beta subunit